MRALKTGEDIYLLKMDPASRALPPRKQETRKMPRMGW